MTDCVGNEIHETAILKVFHFTGSRNRKHFMYKQVGEIFVAKDGSKYHKIFHLPMDREFSFYLKPVDAVLGDSVVVQCNCEFHIYNNLKLCKKFGA